MLSGTAFLVPKILSREIAPLNRLGEEAGRIDANTLSRRFQPDEVPGELKPICEGLNRLLSRLEQSFERERNFSADLAHELRTPIAELKSISEVALKWPESRQTETDHDTLAIALQMEGIVTRLLDLLRSERGQMISRPETICLSAFINSAWRPFRQRAEEKSLAVRFKLPDNDNILSDPALLRSVLTNLFDNAVEYTPAEGAIRIDAEVGSGKYKIEIANTASQLHPDDLPKLFVRFWRKDASRSGTGHSGLGLPLARAFSTALGGELIASLAQGCLVLTLQVSSVP